DVSYVRLRRLNLALSKGLLDPPDCSRSGELRRKLPIDRAQWIRAAALRMIVAHEPVFRSDFDVPDVRCVATSISAVCGNMSKGVTDSIWNTCRNSARSRASVGG